MCGLDEQKDHEPQIYSGCMIFDALPHAQISYDTLISTGTLTPQGISFCEREFGDNQPAKTKGG